MVADVSELAGGYDYHAPAATEVHGDFGGEGGYSSSAPSNSYIPPAASAPASSYIPPAPAASEPVNTYIPPAPAASEPANTYIPPAEASAPAASVEFADDGYRYRTVRRRVYRHRF